MSGRPAVKCWCVEDVPAFALCFMRAVMNPIATEEPVMTVCQYGGGSDPSNDLDLPVTIYSPYIRFPYMSQYGDMAIPAMAAYVLANGPVDVPARTPFDAWQPMLFPQWIGYDQGVDFAGASLSDPEDLWFFPTPGSWFLASTPALPVALDRITPGLEGQTLGVWGPMMFQRMGHADSVRKCVPVLNVTAPFGAWTQTEEE